MDANTANTEEDNELDDSIKDVLVETARISDSQNYRAGGS